MRVAKRAKIPMSCASSWSLLGVRADFAQFRNLVGEGHVEIGKHRLELVEIQVLELEGRAEHDRGTFHSVGGVHERGSVQHEQLAKQRRCKRVVRWCGPNVD